MTDLAVPVLILLPVGAAFLGAIRNGRPWTERAYLVGGLCLVVLFLGNCGLTLYDVWVSDTNRGLVWYAADVFWMPACLVVATTGMLLGCLPHRLHLPSPGGSVLAICYVTAAALVPIGFYANVTCQSYVPDAVAWAILCAILVGICAPACVVTGIWIKSRLGAG